MVSHKFEQQSPRLHLLDRRFALGGMASATVGGWALATRPVLAQESARDLEIVRAIGVQYRRAEFLEYEVATFGPDATDDQLGRASSTDLDIVKSLDVIVANIPAEKRLDYVRSDAIDLGIAMTSAGVELQPSLEIDFETMYTKGYREAALPAPKEEETFFDVFIDIVLETIGIERAIRNGIREFLNERQQLKSTVQAIRAAAANKNWHQTAKLLRFLLDQLLSSEVMKGLAQIIGDDALKQFLRVGAARCVPFIGWALWVAALLTAIYNNWDRLEVVLER